MRTKSKVMLNCPKIKFIIINLSFALTHPICAQDIFVGDITISNQTQIDQFIITNPNSTIIDGDIIIDDSPQNPVINLWGFQNIVTITGDLKLVSPASLASLGGLENLLSVNHLHLQGCQALTNLNAIDNLTFVEEISIIYCLSISYTNLFPNVETLSTGFTLTGPMFEPVSFGLISGFDNLLSAGKCSFSGMIADLEAFNNVDTIYGQMHFQYAQFGTFNSFNNLEHVGGNLNCSLPESNADISFPSLQSVGAILSISGNSATSYTFPSLEIVGSLQSNGVELLCPALSVISENLRLTTGTFLFQPLTTIGGNIELVGTLLNNLDFLSSVPFVGGYISIQNNTQLSNCAAQAICDKISLGHEYEVYIYDNATGCNSREEVQAVCSGNYVSGSVFADMNCNLELDENDILIPYVLIVNENNNPIGSTYGDGNYMVGLSEQNETSLQTQIQQGFEPSTSYTLNSSGIYSNYNFALCPIPDYHDISTSIIGVNNAMPGFYGEIQFKVSNQSVFNEDVEINLDITNMPGATITDTEGGIISNNTISWQILSLGIFQDSIITITFYLDPMTPLGTELVPSLSAFPSINIDDDLSDNSTTWSEIVIGSFDPNNIGVNISEANFNEIPESDGMWLHYTIKFQNTGTAPATFVRVLDMIEDNLNITSLQMLASSHSYQLSFDENELQWLFDNIQLPDSSSDLEGSQGFIHFKIKTVDSLNLEDVIENTAAIYFDYNEPIITNTATTMFYVCPSELVLFGNNEVCEGDDVQVYASVGWDDYSWTLDNEIIGEESALLITSLSDGVYEISYAGTTEFCSDANEFELTINELPETPTMTQFGNLLSATGTGIYTWSLNGNPLSEISNELVINESGLYSVMVTLIACSSETSSGSFIFNSINESDHLIQRKIYPNPMKDNAILSFGAQGNYNVKFMNFLGVEVLKKQVNGTQMYIDKSQLASGNYFVQLNDINKNTLETLKLIVIE